MRFPLQHLVFSCFVALLLSAGFRYVYAQPAQAERRNQLSSPGLTINSKLPTARVNVMKVHGNRLYVAGQDHVVRSYALNDEGDIDIESCKIYRWPSWREERGNILAMAINKDGTKLAIGGVGLKTALVCEIDIETGEIIRFDDSLRSAITEIQYADNDDIWFGSFRGGLVSWPAQKLATIIVKERMQQSATFICAILTLDSGCLAIGADGQVLFIDNGVLKNSSKTLHDPLEEVYSAIRADEKSFAFISRNKGNGINYIKKWSRQTANTSILWQATSNEIVFDALAMDNSGKVTGIGRSLKSDNLSSTVVLLDSDGKTRRDLESVDITEQIASLVFTRERCLFVSAQKQLLRRYAIGENDSVIGSEKKNRGYQIDSVLWTDKESFQWRRDGKSLRFNLKQRGLEFGGVPVAREEGIGVPSPFVDVAADSQLSLKFAKGITKQVSLDLETDRRATACKVIARDGQSLVLVGHRFGVSVFLLGENQELRLIRKLIGHTDDVTSIDFLRDSNLVLTAGRDGAVCCFSLAPWKFQAELGASFRFQNGQLTVVEIDPGSPAWETGLNEGERITNLYYKGAAVDLASAIATLGTPAIGEQFQFQTERLQQGVSTRCLQRPIWKFYERDGEWIWWRWRDYYYDCSTEGERLISWQLNQGFDRVPISIEGHEARARFYRPEKMKDLLDLSKSAPERINAPELVPPRVGMSVVEHQDHYAVTATLEPDENALLFGEPKELSVWVNDYRVSNWSHPVVGRPQSCRIEKNILRSGKNRVIARAFNSIGIRGDSKSQFLSIDPRRNKPTLRGLAIGIRDYSESRRASQGGRGLFAGNLKYTVQDALAIKRIIEKQASGYDVDSVALLNDEATNENVFRQLASFAQTCHPDDWLIVSFAGHGLNWEKPNSTLPSSFMLLTSKTSLVSESAAARTGIPIGSLEGGVEFESLFNALSNIPCRKMLLIDACHSGGALEIVKSLTPDLAVGPTILTAAQGQQKAWEVDTKTHGIFTTAIIEALTNQFSAADRSRDQRLSPRELYEYSSTRVPEILPAVRRFVGEENVQALADLDKGQTPEFWSPSEDQDIPIFARVP